MQAERIIEKAQKLGINIADGNSLEVLEDIASQLGLDPASDASTIENVLDSQLNGGNNSGNTNDGIETLDAPSDMTPDSIPDTGRGRFGEAEYNAAKTEDGVYDKDHYKKKGEELDEKVKKAEEEKKKTQKEVPNKKNGGEAGNDFRNKNFFDKAKDNAELLKAKNDRLQNKINGAKAKAYNAMHPVEALKDQAKAKAKEAAKDAGKKAAKAVGQAAKKAASAVGKKIAAFIASNPVVLIVIGIVILLLLIIILYIGYEEGGSSNDTSYGYYDKSCSFNEVEVILNNSETNSTNYYNLADYVIGMTYSYTKDSNYSETALEALMVIIKTNALSKGKFSGANSSITLTEGDVKYTPLMNIDANTLEELQSIYENVEEELFVFETYESAINSLSLKDSLKLNDEVLQKLKNNSDYYSHEELLASIYNKETNGEEQPETSERPTLIVGDSRVAFMRWRDVVSNDRSVFAGAMGYRWFVGQQETSAGQDTYNCKKNPIQCVNEKVANEPTNIILWLGVNDRLEYQTRQKQYVEKYIELATGEWADHYLYVFSIGYVKSERYGTETNENLKKFNEYLEENINSSGLSNLQYIDLGYDATTMGKNTRDGIHYTDAFSQEIYDRMLELIDASNTIHYNRKIYRLSEFCTFYEFTENEAYWWPIGSEEATSENIYGGTPPDTTIDVSFGYQNINGEYKYHSGIDIAVKNEAIIIASEAGKVTTVYNSCSTAGVHDNSCGDGKGNFVEIEHNDGKTSLYALLPKDAITVNVGDTVVKGQKIGTMQSCNSESDCHLHFEMTINGSKVDPSNYVSIGRPRPTKEINLDLIDDSPTTPEEVKRETCLFLLKNGLSNNAVAAVLANTVAEGGNNPRNLENCYETGRCCTSGDIEYGYCQRESWLKGFGSDDAYTAGVDSGSYPREHFIKDHAGYGLIQWTASGRKEGLYDFAKANNKSIGSLSVQLAWLLKETEQEYFKKLGVHKHLTGNYSAYDTAYNFCYYFEAPSAKDTSCPLRGNNAENLVKYVDNGCSE